MRVLCVNDKWRKPISSINLPSPVCGTEYTVIATKSYPKGHKIDGRILAPGIYFKLSEFEDGRFFHSSLFATLPDVTADEMEEKEREAIKM